MTPTPYAAPYTSAHGRARIVKILLILGAVAAGMSVITETVSLLFPPLADDQELGDNPIGAAVVLIIFLLAVFELFVYVATVDFFLVWLYRAYDNLRAFNSPRRLDHSPGWAVGSFFIPFINLVVPYRAVKEVWQKSGPPDEALLAEPAAPAIFPIWWLFWLLASFAGNISMRASFSDNVSVSTATIVSIVASALSVMAAVFAYLVVNSIDKRQEETSVKLGIQKFTGPPPPPPNLSMSGVVADVSLNNP